MHKRKHPVQTGVKQQRLIAQDEKLIEGEAGRRGNLRDECREPVDAWCDFGDLRFHCGSVLAVVGWQYPTCGTGSLSGGRGRANCGCPRLPVEDCVALGLRTVIKARKD